MRNKGCWRLDSEAATEAFGAALGRAITSGTVYLKGELGTGKTTLCRGLLRERGHRGKVKSPTYTLVEPYTAGAGNVYHFDLYRLSDPEELEFMGIRDYFEPGNLCLVEWPERGRGILPPPDLRVEIRVAGKGREIRIKPVGKTGMAAFNKLRDAGI